MNYKPFGRGVLAGFKNHPWWAAAIAVPVVAWRMLDPAQRRRVKNIRRQRQIR